MQMRPKTRNGWLSSTIGCLFVGYGMFCNMHKLPFAEAYNVVFNPSASVMARRAAAAEAESRRKSDELARSAPAHSPTRWSAMAEAANQRKSDELARSAPAPSPTRWSAVSGRPTDPGGQVHWR
jgi:hypothetical protein